MAAFRYIVTDVDESVEFYTAHLGFTVRKQFGPAIAILTDGSVDLWLAGPPASASRPMPDGTKPAPGGWNRIAIAVDDIELVVAALSAAGARFRNKIVSGPGGKQILLEDPSGNPIELFRPAN